MILFMKYSLTPFNEKEWNVIILIDLLSLKNIDYTPTKGVKSS